MGPQGVQGDARDDGVSVTNVELVNDELIVTLSSGDVRNMGNIRGPQGNAGLRETRASRASGCAR